MVVVNEYVCESWTKKDYGSADPFFMVCVSVRANGYACVRACVCARARVCVCVCECVCECVCVSACV